jgi:glycosyltransferase involved in cell wall biosynthesis
MDDAGRRGEMLSPGRQAGAGASPSRRVLLIVENCSVPFDQRVWLEAKALRDGGYSVCVLSPRARGQLAHEILEGIEVFRHPALPEAAGALGYALEYGAALFWELCFAWRIFFRRGFEVVHLANPPDTLFLVAGLFKLLFGTKVIYDHHDLCPELYEAKFGRKGLGHRITVLLERCSVRVADVVISTNDSYRRMAIERDGKDPSRVFVVRNGPNLERVRLQPKVPEYKRGRRYLVGYVGIIGFQEGLRYLVQAAAHIVHGCNRHDIHFVVIGDGTDLPAVRALAARLEVDDYFTFTGLITDPKVLMGYLSTADICINPDEHNSINNMSTTIKVMEYMALAKPIIQFDTMEGRVSAGESALYALANDSVDLAEKVMMLADDPQLRQVMGSIGRRRIEQELAWVHQAPRLLAVYEALFRDAGPVLVDGARPRESA